MKVRYLFIAAILLAIISIISLRSNAQTTARIRQDIISKDAQALSVSKEIQNLRTFVFSHMNSSVHLELTTGYDRAVAATKAATTNAPSGDLYTQAQATCDRPGVGSVAQAQCVQDFLSSHLQPGANPQPLQLPDRSQYNYTYSAPTWTPDLAGLSLLGSIGLALAALTIYTLNSFRSKSS